MSNMSYCRWENTSQDMADCVEALRDENDAFEFFEGLSEYEKAGFQRFMRQAKQALEMMGATVTDLEIPEGDY